MNLIAVVGSGGGVGTTTVTAHLAATLTAQQHRCIAFDFSPGNALRLHFGMEWSDGSGLVPQVLAGKPWHEVAYSGIEGVDFLPYGQVTTRDHARFCSWCDNQPGWFAQQVERLDEEAETFLLCDCSHQDEAIRAQVLPASQLTLIVLAPDALSYARASEAAQSALGSGAREIAFVVNGFEPARALDRDVAAVLRQDLNYPLSPVMIHRDESVREALANGQTVITYAPSSRAAFDFTAVVSWMLGRIELQARAA